RLSACCSSSLRWWFFFFQAEDGIRDRNVTGVQTCALPIFTTVLVADGDNVRAGDPVLVVEAMKMEHTLHAPGDGTVQLHVAAGHRVARGEEVAQVLPDEPDPPAAVPSAGAPSVAELSGADPSASAPEPTDEQESRR